MRINKIMGSVLPTESAEQRGFWRRFVASAGFLEEIQTTVFFQQSLQTGVRRKHVLQTELVCKCIMYVKNNITYAVLFLSLEKA